MVVFFLYGVSAFSFLSFALPKYCNMQGDEMHQTASCSEHVFSAPSYLFFFLLSTYLFSIFSYSLACPKTKNNSSSSEFGGIDGLGSAFFFLLFLYLLVSHNNSSEKRRLMGFFFGHSTHRPRTILHCALKLGRFDETTKGHFGPKPYCTIIVLSKFHMVMQYRCYSIKLLSVQVGEGDEHSHLC